LLSCHRGARWIPDRRADPLRRRRRHCPTFTFVLIDKRKQLMDSRGYYSRPELLSSRPELLSLLADRTPSAHTHERVPQSASEKGSQNLLTAIA
jgi:hypothetical protein